jgi:uncharacterized membrane protein SpoIIM required for sporulation
MRQAEFERRQEQRWLAFERWLASAGARRRKRARSAPAPETAEAGAPELDALAVPETFRHVCADLALARERQYSADLIDRINGLALRGHHALYRAHARQRPALLAFLTRDFPRLVRREARAVALAALLFFGPLIGLVAAIQVHPEFASVVLAPDELAKFQEMYRSSNQQLGMRASDTNAGMFGFYIWNNVRIGFQTFAGGLLFGLGSIVYLVMNGIYIGAVAGHLTQAGLGQPFWSFAAGHSAMELIAIALSGGAGLKLGWALLAPGRMSRRSALVAAGRDSVRLVLGAAFLFLAAALIEAFWSPVNLADPMPKYAVGGLLWALMLAYLGFAGRGHDA